MPCRCANNLDERQDKWGRRPRNITEGDTVKEGKEGKVLIP